jgi:hypothetical protein
VMEAARADFTQGMQLGAAISTVGAIGLAVFAAVTLRNARVGGQREGHDQPHPAPLAEREIVPAT